MYTGSLFSTTLPILFIFCLLDNSHPNRCEVIRHCGFDLHFLKINDVVHLFTYLLVICVSSFEKCLFRFFAHFLNQVIWGFLLLSCMSFLYILDINPLLDIWCASIFSHSISCLFILVIVAFAVQKLFSLTQLHFSIFAFIACTFVIIFDFQKNHCQDQWQEAFYLCFFL